MMKDIIAPVPVEAIMDELTRDKFFRKTNNAGNEIYVLSAHDSPNIMREIGRLREISFRDSGGGTGLDCDIDDFDTREENYFMQLIVWNPNDKAIMGGYRFLLCDGLPLTRMVKWTHQRVNFSIILKGSCKSFCPTPSSWDDLLCSPITSLPRASRKECIRLTIFGMAWAHWSISILKPSIISAR